jgi:phenylacetate-coenzyme A ligase PaaK-like adenylate-forming protein
MLFPQMSLSKIQKLCEKSDPYNSTVNGEDEFLLAMKENLSWHCERSEFFRKFLNEGKVIINDLSNIDQIPFIIATYFKWHELRSIPDNEVFLHLTSSGTTGQKSQMYFDEWTIKSAQRMVDNIFDYYQWNTPNQKVNYLLFTYAPTEGAKLGTAYTDNFLCKYAPANDVCYALKYLGNEGHRFEVSNVIETILKFNENGLPLRIFGFPAFFYFTLLKMKELKIPPIKLHADSLVFLGGGWKGHQDKMIHKNELYQLANELLGIPLERLRDGFGSVEHCVPYIECARHQFHIPVWSRVLIRDVKTLEVLPEGEVGYLQFISPYITSAPASSVLMTDLARVYKNKKCSCGLNAPYFEIVGRAGVSQNKSCAVAASDLLKDFKGRI